MDAFQEHYESNYHYDAPRSFEFVVTRCLAMSRLIHIRATSQEQARERLEDQASKGLIMGWHDVQLLCPGWDREDDEFEIEGYP